MRAVAASRKIGKRPEVSSDKTGCNGGTASSGARQKIAQHKTNKTRSHTTSSLYTPPQSTSFLGNSLESSELLLPKSSSMIPGQGGTSGTESPQTTKRSDVEKKPHLGDSTPLSPKVSDVGYPNIDSPSSAKFNGPNKKNIKDTMSRTTSNLSHAVSSVATTTGIGGSKMGSKVGAKRSAVEKRYYAKAITLMVVGGLIFAVGIALAGLYFAGYVLIIMAGPICLSIGLLLLVCGIVWMPIIKTKLKRQHQIMSRTFSL